MDMLEAMIRKLAMLQRGRHVSMDLRLLARYARSGPRPNLLVHAMPHKTCCHHLPRCSDTWMRQSMDASKTTRRQERGTTGREAPVDVSHSKVVLVPGIGMSAKTNQVIAVRYACTPASVCCALAMLNR